jgi:bacterial/archaeal transporter family protein
VRRPVPPSGPPDKAVVMPGSPPPWLLFALGSAFFAALTAIFAKLGVSHFNSDLATLVRTVVILAITIAIVSVRGEWRRPDELLARPVLFLVLSGLATGLSWLCYFRALEIGPVSGVVSVDKLSVVLVVAMSAILVGERLTWQVGFGALLVAIGALLVSLPTSA